MHKVILPNWLPLASIKRIFSILNKYGESRLVGGCVRDILSNKVSKDIDIATSIKPEEAIRLLQIENIKAIPTGIKHGTITVIIDNNTLEITTLRKDVECDGRHATVEFTDDWQEDARRRDFTINAMSMDLDGKVYDYFDGLNDLRNNIVRFVGSPDERIQEDCLRILRYFRFYSYLGGQQFDPPSLKAVSKYAHLIANLSKERITQEVLKLLLGKFALDAVILMVNLNVWKYLSVEGPNLEKIKHYSFSSNSIINLSAILRATEDMESNLEKIRSYWRLSNKEYNLLNLLCNKQSDIDLHNELAKKKALFFLGKETFILKLNLALVEQPNIDLREVYKFAEEFVFPEMPINGNDIKRLGFSGKDIKDKILFAINSWINSNFELKKSELLELLKK
jgi:poly(A) polymerase